MSQLALSSDSVAVITGGASGIGLAAAMRLARMGLRICIADLGEDSLAKAAEALAAVAPGGRASIMTMVTDVSRADMIERLEAAVAERFGGTDILMNNAGVQPGSAIPGTAESWERGHRVQARAEGRAADRHGCDGPRAASGAAHRQAMVVHHLRPDRGQLDALPDPGCFGRQIGRERHPAARADLRAVGNPLGDIVTQWPAVARLGASRLGALPLPFRSVDGGSEDVRDVFSGRCSRSTNSISAALLRCSSASRCMPRSDQPPHSRAKGGNYSANFHSGPRH
jgi:hypothetical protein